MNRRRRPLKLHLRAAPKQKVVYRSPPKLSPKIIVPVVLLALVMAGALGFAGVALLNSARTKHQRQTAIGSPSPTASQMVAGTVNPVPATISSPPVALVSATPSPSPLATPISRPTALVKATALAKATVAANGTAVVNDRAPRDVKTPSENARKTAEQRRREAERKRAHLEALHKDHQISDEAYKQGQQEYQTEMEKYRNVVSGEGSASRQP
jgi:hypothetical protein